VLNRVADRFTTEFVHMLNEMRFGQLSAKSIAKFQSLSREVVYEDGLGATELWASC
jgi:ATP-dependent DNA helicase PIF1